MQQAFNDCHGLQCGFCTPGFLTTITAYLEENPDPTRGRGARGDRRQPVPLHRLPEHRGVGAARRRDPRRDGERASRDHQAVRRAGAAGRGPAAAARQRPLPRRPRPRRAGTPRSCAARTRTPGSSTSTSTAALDVDGVLAIYTYDDLDGRDGGAAAAADPAPDADPRPHAVRAGQGRGQPRRRGDRDGRRDRPLRRRGRGRRGSRSTYEFAAAGRRHRGARGRATCSCTTTCPATSAAHMVQEVGDAAAAIAAAPHRLEPRPRRSSAARAMPMEGKGVLARWDADDEPLRVCTLDPDRRPACAQRSRPSSGSPATRSRWSRPTSGGGFGVKIVHPWPEEMLVPWAARALGRPVKWTEDRREHFISSAHERGQLHQVEVGFDDDGRLLGLVGAVLARQRRLHAVRADRADHHLDPAARALQAGRLPGRVRQSLYTNTVIVTPYRGAGRPQGCFAMERTMDAIAGELGLDRAEVARAQLHPARRDALRPRADLPGRPAADLRLRRLPGVAGRSSRRWSGWDDFAAYREQARAEGRRVGIGLACYVEGTGVGPYEGGHVQVETAGKVKVATGLTTPGPGPPDDVRADRRRRARRADRGRRGDHRRHPAVPVRRRAPSPRGPR